MSKKIHLERVNRVTAYLEQNLDAEINVKDLAAMACYSEFHFHRIFHAHIKESVYAYRKRLLLERSVKQLSHSQHSVIDIALDCGYQSPSAFNKAFKQQFGHTPSHVRAHKGCVFKAKPIQQPCGVKPMKAQIKNLPELQLIAARGVGKYADSAAEAWGKVMSFTYSKKLMKPDVMMIGICHDDPHVTEDDRIRYDACLTVNADISDHPELRQHKIEAGRFAVFLHRGSYEHLPQTYDYIFAEWLPESGHQLRDVPSFEKYLNRDPRRTKPENLKTEIHIPIK